MLDPFEWCLAAAFVIICHLCGWCVVAVIQFWSV